VTKIVKLGRWVVGAIFALKGLGMLLAIVPHFLHALRNRIPLTYQDYLVAFPWALYLACAWGVWRWRQWGQIVAIALSAMEIAVVAGITAIYGPLALDRNLMLMAALNCGIVVWLVLPQVRSGYWQRARTA
jgi:hypothetical protein